MPATSTPRRPRISTTSNPLITRATFHTTLHWMAVEFKGSQLAAITFHHATPADALAKLGPGSEPSELSSAQLRVQELLTALAAGDDADCSQLELYPHWRTPFAQRVVFVCRGICRGETLSYGEVAALAGSPGASRAVGNVMSSNPLPLVVPCHRVIGAHGAMGGYSAPGGIAVKRMLLEREGHGRKA